MEYEVAVCSKCGERQPYVSEYHMETWRKNHLCDGTIEKKVVSIRDEKKRNINPVFIGKLLTVLYDNGRQAVGMHWRYDAEELTRPNFTHLGFKYLRQNGRASDEVVEVNKGTVVASLLSHGASLTSMNTINLNHNNRLGYTGRANDSWQIMQTILSPLKGNVFALAYRYDDKTYMTAMTNKKAMNFYERVSYISSPAPVAVEEMDLPPEIKGLFIALYFYNAHETTEQMFKSSFELREPSLEEGAAVPRLTNGVISLILPTAQAKGQDSIEKFALMEISEEDRDVILAKDKKSLVWKSVRARAKGLLL